MADARKIIRFSPNSKAFVEIGPNHIKLAYTEDNFILLNSGGITQQGNINIQGSPTSTSYYGMFNPQNEFLGAFTAGMISAPTYTFSTDWVNIIPSIMALTASILQVTNI